MSNITLNIVEPGSPTPDPVVPNTGLFTHGIGGPEATIITAVSTVLLLTIVVVVVAMLYKKHKKQGKATKLVSTVDACATIVKNKKRVSTSLAAIALLVSAGTFAGLLANAGKSNTNAAEGEDGLTLDVSSEDLTIEVGSEPVFAVLPVELTVEEATQAGYTLTAFTDSTDLVSTTDESNTISMVTAEGDELVALIDNTYGLALAEPEGKDSEVYTTLSTDADVPTLITDKDHKATETGDTTTIYYGFYITPDVPYGTYTGTNINYNVEPHYITNLSFNGNGNDGGVDMEGMTIIAGDTITLPENTFAKEGYNFIGWNTVAEPTEQDPGEAYADQADFTAAEGVTEDITLYAQWEEDVLYMQDVATWSSTLSQGDTMEAVDKRDGKTYYVSRLADNKIWMTQNLDLDLKTDGSIVYDATTTNISSAWTPARATISTSVSGWNNSNNTPYSADPGPLFFYSSGTSSNDDKYTSLEACQEAHSDCSMHNHAGNYYNWSAAVAMNDTSSLTTEYSNAPGSICPAGWRLPTGMDSGDTAASREWNALLYAEGVASSPTGDGYTTDGFNKIRKSPLWLARSGCVSDDSLGDTGSLGYYWSSTVINSNYAYNLYFNSGHVNSVNSHYRNRGFSVRCVAQ